MEDTIWNGLSHLPGMLKPKILAVGEAVPGVGEYVCAECLRSVWLLQEHTRRLLLVIAVCA